MDSPFLRPTDPRLAEIVTDGAVHILAGHGVDRFSIRAIARWMRVTPAYLLNDFSRARLVEIILITFGDRWIQWCGAETAPNGVGLRLPETPDECAGVRVRAALEQLADAEWLRGNPLPAHQVSDMAAREASLLAHRMHAASPPCCAPGRDEVIGVQALLHGLRQQMASPESPMPLDRARSVLDSATAGLTSHRPGCPLAALAG